MTKRTRYGGEGCVVGFGLDYACAHIIILAEISSENLLPIRADFVTERGIGWQLCFWRSMHSLLKLKSRASH